jgi:AraC family transcriptional activator of pobA
VKNIVPVIGLDRFLNSGKEQGFYAARFISYLRQNPFVRLSHRHSFYLVTLFTRGNGHHEVDFHSYKIKPGRVFFMRPGQAHRWNLTRQTDGYIFLHTKEFYELPFSGKKMTDFPFFQTSYSSPEIILKTRDAQKMELLFRELVAEFNQKPLYAFEKIHSCINLIYITLMRRYLEQKKISRHKPPASLLKLAQLEELIEIHYKTIRSPSSYAAMLHISSKHLNRLCMLTLHKTTSDLIASRLILEAKRMLAYGHNNIAEVALHMGFVDTAYFSRYFRKRCGESPAEFMKKYH